MKLYDGGRAPNPRRVRIFLAEKGVSVPMEPVNLGALEHKTQAYTAINPLQRVPALVLDDGTVITESMAICRYFEASRPEPPLFGHGGREAALVEMWNRRLELNLYEAVAAVFRHLHPAMREMESQVPAWGEANKPRVSKFLALLDRELADRLYVAGDH
jgi:glutathione S-transferase